MPYPDSDYERSWKTRARSVTLYPTTKARLFAAAPELLAIAKRLLCNLVVDCESDDELRSDAEAAIAKAEGRSE